MKKYYKIVNNTNKSVKYTTSLFKAYVFLIVMVLRRQEGTLKSTTKPLLGASQQDKE